LDYTAAVKPLYSSSRLVTLCLSEVPSPADASSSGIRLIGKPSGGGTDQGLRLRGVPFFSKAWLDLFSAASIYGQTFHPRVVYQELTASLWSAMEAQNANT